MSSSSTTTTTTTTCAGMVYAIEAQHIPSQMLNGNVAINAITNVNTIHAVVGGGSKTQIEVPPHAARI